MTSVSKLTEDITDLKVDQVRLEGEFKSPDEKLTGKINALEEKTEIKRMLASLHSKAESRLLNAHITLFSIPITLGRIIFPEIIN
jgi:hypothetical protein